MSQTNEPRFKKIKNAFRLYKYKVYWVLLAFLILTLLAYFHYGFIDIFLQAILAVMSTLLVLIIIDSVKQEVEEEEHDNYIKDIVWDALRMDNRLLKLYNKESIEQVMQNCIGHFCPHLAKSYVDYILNNLNVFRKDFSYHIEIKGNKLDSDSVLISHILSYTRFFKIDNLNRDVQLQCRFTTKIGELDKTMHNNSLFFREELLYTPLLQQISQTTNNTDLIDLLGIAFRIGENGESIDRSKIEVNRDDYGITFSAIIDPKYLSNNAVDFGGGYVSYHAEIECEYTANLDNRFYCIFSNPTIGNTNFSIEFDKTIVSNIDDVDRLTMLSNTKYKLTTIPKFNKIQFNTTQAIFPRSGILIQWDKQN